MPPNDSTASAVTPQQVIEEPEYIKHIRHLHEHFSSYAYPPKLHESDLRRILECYDAVVAENQILRRAVQEFLPRCPTCHGIRPNGLGSRDSHATGCPYRDGDKDCTCGTRVKPCPVCTPLREAIGGLR
jgi:hypothetical protein